MMKSFVITIMDNPQSVKVAERCIKSAKKVGHVVEKYHAVTPRSEGFMDMVEDAELNIDQFSSKWSRPENALACFLSHMSLWKYSILNKCEVMILEHDAVFTNSVPYIPFDKCVTIGKPSYGKFNTPQSWGVQPLVQKRYFGGAHAYIINPTGAKKLLDKVPDHSCPTDVYLHADNFPWLQEFYPWPVSVDDSFSTIQEEAGCIAKHNYNKGIELIRA